MTDQSLKSKEPISQGTHSAISLQASGDGPSLLSSQGGLQLDLFGQAPVPVSPSATQGHRVGPTTQDTSGPTSDDSSRSLSHDLQLSLGSRLRQNLEGRGSPEYALTLKNWDMESGVPIFAVRASGHRTSGNASTGWATPQARDYRSAEGNKPRWENPDRSRNLNDQAKALSGWPTPQVVDSGKLGNRPNYGQVGLSNHPGLRGFPDRPPMKKSRSGDGQLTQPTAGWPTPSSMPRGPHSGRDSNNMQTVSKTTGTRFGMTLETASVVLPLGTEPSGSSASTTGKGGLNPEFVRWLMGFPEGWSSYAPTATRSSRKSGRSS